MVEGSRVKVTGYLRSGVGLSVLGSEVTGLRVKATGFLRLG